MEKLKEFCYNEIKTKRPEALVQFEELWITISKFVKTEEQVKGFLKGYFGL